MVLVGANSGTFLATHADISGLQWTCLMRVSVGGMVDSAKATSKAIPNSTSQQLASASGEHSRNVIYLVNYHRNVISRMVRRLNFWWKLE